MSVFSTAPAASAPFSSSSALSSPSPPPAPSRHILPNSQEPHVHPSQHLLSSSPIASPRSLSRVSLLDDDDDDEQDTDMEMEMGDAGEGEDGATAVSRCRLVANLSMELEELASDVDRSMRSSLGAGGDDDAGDPSMSASAAAEMSLGAPEDDEDEDATADQHSFSASPDIAINGGFLDASSGVFGSTSLRGDHDGLVGGGNRTRSTGLERRTTPRSPLAMPSVGPAGDIDDLQESSDDDDDDGDHGGLVVSPTAQRRSSSRSSSSSLEQLAPPSFGQSLKPQQQQLLQRATFGRSSSRPLGPQLRAQPRPSALPFERSKSMTGAMGPPALPTAASSTLDGPQRQRTTSTSSSSSSSLFARVGEKKLSSSRLGQGSLAATRSIRPSPKRGDSLPIASSSLLTAGDPCSSSGSPVRRNAKSATDFMQLGGSSHQPRDDLMSSTPARDLAFDFEGSPNMDDFFGMSPSHGAILHGKSKLLTEASSSPESPGADSPTTSRAMPGRSTVMAKSLSLSGSVLGTTRMHGTGPRSRAGPYHRPARPPLAPIVADGPASRMNSTASALPILESCTDALPSTAAPVIDNEPRLRPGPVAMRRAYSVCDNAAESPLSRKVVEGKENIVIGKRTVVSQYETGPGLQHVGGRLAPSDGSCTPAATGLLGFGENELDGKILPCHRVKEDGLVRVKAETVRALKQGHYDDRVSRYIIIDCRFGYEYEGGHIEGATNATSIEQVEELLLQAGKGIYADGGELPTPSRSGDHTPEQKPIVLIFHCEFSLQRAPSFAKTFRSKDRSQNHECYPKVFYPELYILEGGYSKFFESHADICDPPAYVRMDDRRFQARRNSDLDQFRKFSRTQSFTYGQKQTVAPAPRMSVPCAPLAFGAGGASSAASRNSIAEEDSDVSMASPCAPPPSLGVVAKNRFAAMQLDSPGGDSSDGSPCAVRPSTLTGKAGVGGGGGNLLPMFGSSVAKARLLERPGSLAARGAFARTATFAGSSSRK